MTTAIIPSAPAAPLDLVIAAWLDAAGGHSGSARTLHTYTETIGAFREALRVVGLDLDGDPATVAIALQGWAAGRYRDGVRVSGDVSAATYNQRCAIVSSWYRYAMVRGVVGRNPADMIERRRVTPYAKARGLEPDAIRERLAAIDTSAPGGQRDRILLRVMLATGRRAAEIAALRCGDVGISAHGVVLEWRRVKGGKSARSVLGPRDGRALLAYLGDVYGDLATVPPGAAVWPSYSRQTAGRPIGVQTIDDICRTHLHCAPHELRHTFARNLMRVGASIEAIRAALGHSSLAVTTTYLAQLADATNPHGAAMEALYLGDE